MTVIEWAGVEAGTRETCVVDEGSDAVVLSGRIAGGALPVRYRIELSPSWSFRSMTLQVADRERVILRNDGHWFVDGAVRPDLAEAVEIDVAASPVSNTFPIRRLGLAIGESADIVTAYVVDATAPVVPDPQRYTRLSDTEYLYESRDSDFRRVVRVDGQGYVVDYPGLFTRAGEDR